MTNTLDTLGKKLSINQSFNQATVWNAVSQFGGIVIFPICVFDRVLLEINEIIHKK